MARIKNKEYKPYWGDILLGIVLIMFGIYFYNNPVTTIVGLVQFLGFFWIIIGIFNLLTIFIKDEQSRGWRMLKGIFDIILGLIVIYYPFFSAIIIPTILLLILAIWGLILGIIGIIGGFHNKEATPIIIGIISIGISILIFASPILSATYFMYIAMLLSIPAGIILIVKSVF